MEGGGQAHPWPRAQRWAGLGPATGLGPGSVCVITAKKKFIYLPDPRGAGHVEAFQFLSVCLYVCMSVCMYVCMSVLTLNFKASHWMIDYG